MEVVRDQVRTIASSSAPSRTSTRWASTPATAITVAPALTLTDKEYQVMRDASLAVLREIGVETGGSNVQFAINPENGRMIVIEMNPRVSRSSALASKATGFPIAKRRRPSSPSATRSTRSPTTSRAGRPRRQLRADDRLHRHQDPALRLREIPRRRADPHHLDEVGRRGHGHRADLRRKPAEGAALARNRSHRPRRDPDRGLGQGRRPHRRCAPPSAGPTPDRLLNVAQALRHGMSHADIYEACRIDPWFIEQSAGASSTSKCARCVKLRGAAHGRATCGGLKAAGFSDSRLGGPVAAWSEAEVAALRALAWTCVPVYKRIDTCAAEFASPTAYMYSTYAAPFAGRARRTKSRPERRARRSSSSAAVPTGSARASNSTIAAATPASR